MEKNATESFKTGIFAGIGFVLVIAIAFAAVSFVTANERTKATTMISSDMGEMMKGTKGNGNMAMNNENMPEMMGEGMMGNGNMQGMMGMMNHMSKMMSKENMAMMKEHMKECSEMMDNM